MKNYLYVSHCGNLQTPSAIYGKSLNVVVNSFTRSPMFYSTGQVFDGEQYEFCMTTKDGIIVRLLLCPSATESELIRVLTEASLPDGDRVTLQVGEFDRLQATPVKKVLPRIILVASENRAPSRITEAGHFYTLDEDKVETPLGAYLPMLFLGCVPVALDYSDRGGKTIRHEAGTPGFNEIKSRLNDKSARFPEVTYGDEYTVEFEGNQYTLFISYRRALQDLGVSSDLSQFLTHAIDSGEDVLVSSELLYSNGCCFYRIRSQKLGSRFM